MSNPKRFKGHVDLGKFVEKATSQGTVFLSGAIFLDGIVLAIALWPDGRGGYTAFASQRDVREIEDRLWTRPAKTLDDWLKN